MAVKMVGVERVIDWGYEIANQTLTGAGEKDACLYQVSIKLERQHVTRVPESAAVDALVKEALGRRTDPHNLAAFLASETGCRVSIHASLIGSAASFMVRAGF